MVPLLLRFFIFFFFFLILRPPPNSPLFPYTTLFRSDVHLTARRSDLENAINTFFPIKTVDKLNVGDLVKIGDSDAPVQILSMDKGVVVDQDGTKKKIGRAHV